MPTCSECQGYGLVPHTFECRHCHGKVCYLCENVNKHWVECQHCNIQNTSKSKTKK